MPLMVMPYMHHGDVKSFVKSKRANTVKIQQYPLVKFTFILHISNVGVKLATNIYPVANVHSYVHNTTRIFANMWLDSYWKTDWNITLGLFYFIGPADNHTHTLLKHCCINRFSWLVCFSRAGFADYVKSHLRKWGPWKALDGRYGSDIHQCVGGTFLRPSRLVWLALLGLIEPPNSFVRRCNLPPATHPSHPPHPLPPIPLPFHPPTPLYIQSVILQ